MPKVMRCYTGDNITECFWAVSHTVGIGATNEELDVMIVQFLLNKTLRRLHYKSKLTKVSGCELTGNWDAQTVKALREFFRLVVKFGYKLPNTDIKGHRISPPKSIMEDDTHISTMAALTAMALNGQHFAWSLGELPPVLKGCAHRFVDVMSNSPLALAS
jgi:hypothetical protein